jgi:hypothetical protein
VTEHSGADHEAPPGDPGSPDVGSVAEEAVKLAGALRDWARESGAAQAGVTVQGLSEDLRSVGDHVGHGQDCTLCPVCQGIRVLRQTSPEVREHLAAAIGSLADAATALLRQDARPEQGEGQDGIGAPRRRGSSPRSVDLDD